MEHAPKTTGEYELPTLKVGDVILFKEEAKPSSFRRPNLVTTTYKSGQFESLTLADDKHNHYGMPGTGNPEDVKEVIDHFTLEKTAECLAMAFNPGADLTPDLVEKVVKNLQEDVS